MSQLQTLLELAKQYFYYRVIHILFVVGVWGFYSGALLRASNNNLNIAFINQGIFFAALFFGNLVATYFLNKFSFSVNFNIANFLRALGLIIAAVYSQDITSIFFITSILIGVGVGWYWCITNLMTLNQVTGVSRSKILSVLTSVELGSEVFLSFGIGLFVSNLGYGFLFLIAGILLVLSSLKPWPININSNDKISLKELKQITKHPQFKLYFGVMLIESFTDAIKAGTALILPFYFISSDLNVGIFFSFVGIFGATFAYWHRQDVTNSKVKSAYIGGTVSAIATLSLAIFWHPIALLIQNLGQKIATATYQPVGQDLQFTSNALLIRNLKSDGSTELLMLREIIYFVARMILLTIFMLVVFVVKTDVTFILRLLIAITCAREFITIFLQRFLIKKLQITPAILA